MKTVHVSYKDGNCSRFDRVSEIERWDDRIVIHNEDISGIKWMNVVYLGEVKSYSISK